MNLPPRAQWLEVDPRSGVRAGRPRAPGELIGRGTGGRRIETVVAGATGSTDIQGVGADYPAIVAWRLALGRPLTRDDGNGRASHEVYAERFPNGENQIDAFIPAHPIEAPGQE